MSDVKYLAAETRRIGMGEVFKSEDVVSFVEAVLKVTAEKAKYISAYKADFLQERSWEAQCERLVPLYERLTGLHGEASTPSVFKVDEPQSKPKTMNFKEFYAKFLSANTTS